MAELEPEIESGGGLSEVSHFIEVQCGLGEIGRLVNEPAIFGANTKVSRYIKVEASTVDKSSTGLPINAIREVINRIENQRTAARQDIWPNVRDSNRDMKNERSQNFMEVRAYPGLAE